MKTKKYKLVFLGGKVEDFTGTLKDLIEKYSGYDLFHRNKVVTEKSRLADGAEILAVPRTTKA